MFEQQNNLSSQNTSHISSQNNFGTNNSSKLEEININLERIDRKLGNWWLALGKGFLSGFGYVLGAGVAVILIGWFLTVIGVIPALTKTSNQWRDAFTQLREIKTPSVETQTEQ